MRRVAIMPFAQLWLSGVYFDGEDDDYRYSFTRPHQRSVELRGTGRLIAAAWAARFDALERGNVGQLFALVMDGFQTRRLHLRLAMEDVPLAA